MLIFGLQCHNVPLGKMTKLTGKVLASRVGTVLDVAPKDNGQLLGKFLRVRVRLDVEQPLCRGTKLFLPDGEAELIEFKYEKLPKFCYGCGRIGHIFPDCNFILESHKTLSEQPYGAFLKADKGQKFSKPVSRRNAENSVFDGDWFLQSEKASDNLVLGFLTVVMPIALPYSYSLL